MPRWRRAAVGTTGALTRNKAQPSTGGLPFKIVVAAAAIGAGVLRRWAFRPCSAKPLADAIWPRVLVFVLWVGIMAGEERREMRLIGGCRLPDAASNG